jgi:hypothetical protein
MAAASARRISNVGGRPSVLRVVLAIVAIAALATATWLGVAGRRRADRATALRRANTAAIARNRALSVQLTELSAANGRIQARIARVDGDRRTTVARMDALVRAWNEWLTAKNDVIESANGLVDAAAEPSGSQVRSALGPRMRTLSVKEAAFRDEVVKFAAAASSARHDASGKP